MAKKKKKIYGFEGYVISLKATRCIKRKPVKGVQGHVEFEKAYLPVFNIQ